MTVDWVEGCLREGTGEVWEGRAGGEDEGRGGGGD